MTPERFARVDELFGAARKLAPPARGPFLDQMCGDDRALRDELDALLAHHDSPPGFLSTGFIDEPLPAAAESGPIPERIGKYRILRKIGEGGFGVVYLAEQDHPRRQVAIKMLRAHLASPSLLQRFRFEAELLGRLVHPGIARIYEAGAETKADGVQAFFAMEYVEGARLDDFVRAQRLGSRDVLELFARIADAIEYAHQQGIIHRDLKPQNVLIGSDGQPRVVDFGVARDLASGAASRITEAGHLLGTLPYMSPEQLAEDPRGVDTRSDVFALGVMLYQTLSGRLPYDVEDQPLALVLQRRCQDDALPLGALLPALRGEVETLVAKAMERNRERRYQSAGALATDIRRFLRGDPIEAKRDSAMYVLRKRLQRYRGMVVAGTLLLGLTVVFAVTSFLQSRRNALLATREAAARHAADEQAERYRRSLYISRIAQAATAIENNRITSTQMLLEQCPEDLHGWEWAYLNRLADSSLRSLSAHTDPVHCVSWSRDGSRLLACDFGHNVEIWRERDGEHLAHIDVNHPTANWLALSPNGACMAVGGMNGISLIDATTGVQLAMLSGHEATVEHVAFSRDGRLLVSASEDHTLKIWDLPTQQPLQTLHGHEASVRWAEFSPDGRWVVSASFDGTVRLWDVSSGAQVWSTEPSKLGAWSAQFSPDGQFIASGGADAKVSLREVSSGRVLRTLGDKWEQVNSLDFSADGRWLAVGCYDGTIRVVDLRVESDAQERTLRGHGQQIFAVSWQPDAKSELPAVNSTERSARTRPLLASASRDGSVKVWDPFASTARRTVAAHDKSVAGVVFLPDSRRLLTGGGHSLKLWDVTCGDDKPFQPILVLPQPMRVMAALVTPDGKLAISASVDESVRIWDIASGEQLRTLGGHGTPFSLAVDARGGRLAAGFENGGVTIWDLSDVHELVSIAAHDDRVVGLSFSADGQFLATASFDGTLRLWEPRTQRNVWMVGVPNARPEASGAARTPQQMFFTALFTPEGNQVLSTDKTGLIRWWDSRSGAAVRSLAQQTGSVYTAAFSPDGTRLLSAGYNAHVKLSDLVSGDEVLTLAETLSQTCQCVAFSPDGKRIAAGDRDGVLSVWSTVADEP